MEVWETLSGYTFQSTKHPELRFRRSGDRGSRRAGIGMGL